MRFGFTALPGLFDLAVGPLFVVAAKDRTSPVGPGAGNVLASRPALNALHGDQGNPVVGIARNLRALAGAWRRR